MLQNAQETRRILIQTAGQLFAEKGLQVPFREIVAVAHQSLGSIRYHFSSREGLLEAVMEFATRGWRNHEKQINTMLDESASLFDHPDDRHALLVRTYSYILYFMEEPQKIPFWTFRFLGHVMSTTNPPACRQKLIELVVEPNRKSVIRFINTYCPGITQLEANILNLNLFTFPVYHYNATFSLAQRIPFLPDIEPPLFYKEVRRSLIDSAWIILESKRKEYACPQST